MLLNAQYSYDRTVYGAESNDIDIAIAGEALISQGLSIYTEPNFLKLVELIRGADTAYVHGEMLFHNYEHPATDKRTGTFMRCDPKYIEDLKWMGFRLMSLACNHSIDFGEGGVLKNIENLNKYGMVHAGTGRNLSEARAGVPGNSQGPRCPPFRHDDAVLVGPRKRAAARHAGPAGGESPAPLHGAHRRPRDVRRDPAVR